MVGPTGSKFTSDHLTLVIYVFSWWLFFFVPHRTNQAPLNNWCPIKKSNRITPVHLVHWLDCNDRKIGSNSSRSLAICLPYTLDCCMLDYGCQIIRYFLRCWKGVCGIHMVCHLPQPQQIVIHPTTVEQAPRSDLSFGLQIAFCEIIMRVCTGKWSKGCGFDWVWFPRPPTSTN